MTDADRFKLLYGPYRAPRVRKGDVVFCDVRGEVVVCGMSSGPIPWPVTRHKRGRPFLIVCAGLAEAVRRESNQAVAFWWGIKPQTVTAYRKALGVPRKTEGSSRLYRDAFLESVPPEARERGIRNASSPAANAKKSAAKRGKPQTPLPQQAGRGVGLSSAGLKKLCYRSPKARPQRINRGYETPRKVWDVNVIREVQLLRSAEK